VTQNLYVYDYVIVVNLKSGRCQSQEKVVVRAVKVVVRIESIGSVQKSVGSVQKSVSGYLCRALP